MKPTEPALKAVVVFFPASQPLTQHGGRLGAQGCCTMWRAGVRSAIHRKKSLRRREGRQSSKSMAVIPLCFRLSAVVQTKEKLVYFHSLASRDFLLNRPMGAA